MAIIDPEGLFSGERLAACSDLAQLYWPRLFLAANSCGRIELSYKSLVSHVFGNFQVIPESSKIWEVFREYDANFLAVLYETEGGTWWCQFITSEKFLPKYKKTRDNLSPAPPLEALEAHRKGYLEWKKSKSFQNQSFQKISPSFSSEGVGIGVGEGVVVKDLKPSREKKPREEPTKSEIVKTRHAGFKEKIKHYWEYKNPDVEMPWGPGEGKQLAMWLAESPLTSVEQFTGFLRNRARSEVNHAERPSVWIRNVTSYAKGPLDNFKQPLNGGTNGKQTGRTEKTLSAGAGAAQDILDAGTDYPVEDNREVDGDDVFSCSGCEQGLFSDHVGSTIEGEY